jgi:guanylate kinase
MNKRIILVGPTASGKTFLRKRFEERGFNCDVSYTSRSPRYELGELNGVHYHFLERDQFVDLVRKDFFYEWVEYNGNYYGTGLKEWNTLPLFIMETDGIKHIKPEDRKSCFIIYLHPPMFIRYERMEKERRWDKKTILERIKTDDEKFKDFSDYDLKITNPDF